VKKASSSPPPSSSSLCLVQPCRDVMFPKQPRPAGGDGEVVATLLNCYFILRQADSHKGDSCCACAPPYRGPQRAEMKALRPTASACVSLGRRDQSSLPVLDLRFRRNVVWDIYRHVVS
jgi:hypothetical protein